MYTQASCLHHGTNVSNHQLTVSLIHVPELLLPQTRRNEIIKQLNKVLKLGLVRRCVIVYHLFSLYWTPFMIRLPGKISYKHLPHYGCSIQYMIRVLETQNIWPRQKLNLHLHTSYKELNPECRILSPECYITQQKTVYRLSYGAYVVMKYTYNFHFKNIMYVCNIVIMMLCMTTAPNSLITGATTWYYGRGTQPAFIIQAEQSSAKLRKA